MGGEGVHGDTSAVTAGRGSDPPLSKRLSMPRRTAGQITYIAWSNLLLIDVRARWLYSKRIWQLEVLDAPCCDVQVTVWWPSPRPSKVVAQKSLAPQMDTAKPKAAEYSSETLSILERIGQPAAAAAEQARPMLVGPQLDIDTYGTDFSAQEVVVVDLNISTTAGEQYSRGRRASD